MFHGKHHPPGTPPATLASPDPTDHAPAVVTLIEYDEQSLEERNVVNIEEIFGCRDNEKVSWINIDGIADVALLQKVATHFGLHPLALEDVLNTSQRPKLEEYKDHFFIVSRMVYGDAVDTLRFEQFSMFLGKNFLITIQEDADYDVFDPIRKRIRQGRGMIRKTKNDYLAYALLDAIVDFYFPVLESIGESVETIEEQLLETPTRQLALDLHEMKRKLLQLRRSAWPQREIISQLHRDDSGLVQAETKIFLRDCYDHTIQIMDVIESYRDITTGLMDLYLSSISTRTNEVMRILTIISSIFIPITFIAGVYGMNFDPKASPFNMPELGTRYGYPICLSVMLLIVVGMLTFFKKKKWS